MSANPPREFGIAYGLGAAGGSTWTDKGAAGTVLVAGSDGRPSMTTVGTSGLAADAVTFAKMQNISTDVLIGRDTASSGDPEEISVSGGLEFTGSAGIRRSALTGDVTASAGSNATTIANDAVTYAKMQNVSAATRLLGRGSASGAGDPEELTVGTGLSLSGTVLSSTVTSRAPLQFMSVSIQLDAAATRFIGGFLSATETEVQIPCPYAGTLRNMCIRTSATIDTGGGSQRYDFTLRKSGADTALTAALIDAQTVTDTTHTVSVAQNDPLCIKAVPSGTPAAVAVVITVELFA